MFLSDSHFRVKAIPIGHIVHAVEAVVWPGVRVRPINDQLLTSVDQQSGFLSLLAVAVVEAAIRNLCGGFRINCLNPPKSTS